MLIDYLLSVHNIIVYILQYSTRLQRFWSDVAKYMSMNHQPGVAPTQPLVSFYLFHTCPSPCPSSLQLASVIFLQIGWPATGASLSWILIPEA
jgi:hypothetical protein